MLKSKLVARFHHLYMIQALLEIQRHCNTLYSRFKRKVLFIIHKKLHLSELMLILKPTQSKQTYQEDNCSYKPQIDGSYNGRASNFLENLNHLLNDQQNPTSDAVSIPMQMLLLPFIVQPHGFLANIKKPTPSSHMYNNNNNKNDSQQWHENANKGKGYSLNQFVTLVPSQMISAQSQSVSISEHSSLMIPEQRNQIQFPPECRHNSSSFRSSWSAKLDGSSHRLTMRNPLIANISASRR